LKTEFLRYTEIVTVLIAFSSGISISFNETIWSIIINSLFLKKKAYMGIMYFFIVAVGGGTLYHLWRFLQCVNYIILVFTPSTALLHPLSPDTWNSFNRYHFCIYKHVYTLFAPYLSSRTYAFHLLLPPLLSPPPPP
jgi:hypothetical protein